MSAGSSSGTVHIFSLFNYLDDVKISNHHQEKPKQTSVFSISNILPEPAQEFAESTRAIVVTKIPGLESEFIVYLVNGQGKRDGDSIEVLKVIVCTRNGYLYRFSICDSLKRDVNEKSPSGSRGYICTLEDEYNVVNDFIDASVK